jgi:hypothetical protein
MMVVEPHATVHQMVTVVRGRLREDADAIECVRAAFPPGSMTGAPKLRTMEIIDRIEGRPRGVYAGVLGFFSVNGAADLSVVIRTLVASPDGLTSGAGGAIVAASDPEAELEEMLLKARPLLAAVGGTLEVAGDVVGHRDDFARPRGGGVRDDPGRRRGTPPRRPPRPPAGERARAHAGSSATSSMRRWPRPGTAPNGAAAPARRRDAVAAGDRGAASLNCCSGAAECGPAAGLIAAPRPASGSTAGASTTLTHGPAPRPDRRGRRGPRSGMGQRVGARGRG